MQRIPCIIRIEEKKTTFLHSCIQLKNRSKCYEKIYGATELMSHTVDIEDDDEYEESIFSRKQGGSNK